MNLIVRIRQLIDSARNRLLAIPLALVLVGMVLSQTLLALDRRYTDPPRFARTTVDSANTILSTIAGGLISGVTLLLTLVLIAVQVASSQFSPRTLRTWTGNRVLQTAVGLVLGTSVYCLLVLRDVRSFSEGAAVVPNISVIVGVLGGVASLVSVIVAVDHLADQLRIGSVVSRLAYQTGRLIADTADEDRGDPAAAPLRRASGERSETPPERARPVPAPRAGWVQQIDAATMLGALPPGGRAYVPISPGAYVVEDMPLAWVWPSEDELEADWDELVGDRDEDEDVFDLGAIAGSFAIGDARTMQQDVGFGITQMVDIGVRALSPGVNDPSTANDVLAHLGSVLLALWAEELDDDVHADDDDRRLRQERPDHIDYLRAAVDQFRRYGAGDPTVVSTALRTLDLVRTEAKRRGLPGPIEPLDEAIDAFLAAAEKQLDEIDLVLVRNVLD